MFIIIDGETLNVHCIRADGYLPTIDTDGGEFMLAESREAAGEAAREYWEELVTSDPQEAACLIGTETLVAWALGQSAGPGSTQVRSLAEWLDLWLDAPEEQWASDDGEERTVDAPEGFDPDTDPDDYPVPADDDDDSDPAAVVLWFARLCDRLGFVPTVAYRCN